MLFMTTGGAYQVVQAPGDPDRVSVATYDRESAQTAVDGLEMLCGVECAIQGEAGLYTFQVDKEYFADWVAEEIRQYLNYEIFELALAQSRGDAWMMAHGEIKGSLHNTTISFPPI